ncbi:MAG: TRAP transporter small permease subunit [Rhodospirillaceae bacterium]|jgi:TRAP-type mannitol/chloroaromatic compound transport system permease small subunit|nr:TRAP transporter small permease subunit [Rhodospirillaceae bacterium]MBT5455225.1 TRAP transporter small permease subunit [Rhodospirillaceae bacterium]
MDRVAAIARALDRIIMRIGRLAGWAGLALVLVTIFDVVTRNMSQAPWEFLRRASEIQQAIFGSTQLQELEWHLHTVLFLLCLGYAYVKGAHVRIDLIRGRLSERPRAWIEIIGIGLFLVPFCGLVMVYGMEFALSSFQQNEGSASGGGLPDRWIIKSVLPLGIGLLALAGIAQFLNRLALLRRRPGG